MSKSDTPNNVCGGAEPVVGVIASTTVGVVAGETNLKSGKYHSLRLWRTPMKWIRGTTQLGGSKRISDLGSRASSRWAFGSHFR